MHTENKLKLVSVEKLHDIAIEAYIYFYSLISMDITRRITINTPPGVKAGFGPANMFHHMRAFPTADFREVVRPNFDTLYSVSWLDLSKEPVIISVPDTKGRYYLLPMLDMWSDVFAVPGSRTSGTSARLFAIIPDGWKGKLPEGSEIIKSPTKHVWIIGRTQTNGIKDYPSVHKIQDELKVCLLSEFGKEAKYAEFKQDSSVDLKTPPLVQINTMKADKYFSYAAELMKLNKPHITDWSALNRFKQLGIIEGKSFDYNSATPDVKAALDYAVVEGLKIMQDKVPTLTRIANGWSMSTNSMGVYGNYYLKRAVIAMIGLGANQPEDAVYPMCLYDADGKALDGNYDYILHFSKEELPPVEAFWSVTMYDAEGFQAANVLNRFAIGDRDDLKYNSDGSLDLYIQHTSPGAEKESNWLPAPACPLGVTMRLYAPKASVLDGRWNPPAIKCVK